MGIGRKNACRTTHFPNRCGLNECLNQRAFNGFTELKKFIRHLSLDAIQIGIDLRVANTEGRSSKGKTNIWTHFRNDTAKAVLIHIDILRQELIGIRHQLFGLLW